MATATLNISLPESMKAQVEKLVETEGYGNTSEFFRDLVRTYLKQRQDRRIEELILEGIDSGESVPFTKSDIDRARQEVRERIIARTSGK